MLQHWWNCINIARRVWVKDAWSCERNTKLELVISCKSKQWYYIIVIMCGSNSREMRQQIDMTINENVSKTMVVDLLQKMYYICWYKHGLWYRYMVSNIVASMNCIMRISTWQSVPHVYVKMGEGGCKTGDVAWKSAKDLKKKKVELCLPSHLM